MYVCIYNEQTSFLPAILESYLTRPRCAIIERSNYARVRVGRDPNPILRAA